MKTRRESSSRQTDIKRLFRGSLEAWLPLFHRLVARLSQLPRLEVIAARGSVALKRADPVRKSVGSIHVKKDGLLIGLSLPAGALIRSPRLEVLDKRRRDGATHTVLVTRASEIDTDLLNWIKAARPRAGKPRRKST